MIMKFISITSLCFLFIFSSCGKKEENVQTETQQKQTQQGQQEQTQPKQTDTTGLTKTQTQETGIKKEEEKKKEDLKKIDDGTVKETADIDFAAIWKKKCVKCHGSNGKGKVEGVPDLTNVIIKKKSDKTLINSITNGIKGETEEDEDMPAWKGKLTEDEIKAAVKYVKGL